MTRGLPSDDPLRMLPPTQLKTLLDALIDSWPTWGLKSDSHLGLEIAASVHRGKPLAAGEPVPGCSCPTCTGLAADHPARRKQTRPTDGGRRRRWAETVDDARRISLMEVVRRLGLGDPVPQGRRLVLSCPLHEDHRPSMSLDPDRGLWYCFPCAEGGDGIRLWMRVRGVGFADAVKDLAA